MSEKKYTPCGGCGATDPIQRCLGCAHPFRPIETAMTGRWVNLSENYTEDWAIMHCRFADDKYKLDTDLFDEKDGCLIKKGGTGAVRLSEVEYLIESESPAVQPAAELLQLRQWKKEALLIINPIMEYAQGHKDAKLGSSLTEFVINRCKELDRIKAEQPVADKSGFRETIEDILLSTGKHSQEQCSEIADVILSDFSIGISYKRKAEQPVAIWLEADTKPQHNVGVLVFIPGEDNHITSGMWDISNKWVLLDEYRTPEEEVTHWMPLPAFPEGYPRDTLSDEWVSTLKAIAKEELAKRASKEGNKGQEVMPLTEEEEQFMQDCNFHSLVDGGAKILTENDEGARMDKADLVRLSDILFRYANQQNRNNVND